MTPNVDGQSWTAWVMLGETRYERFQFQFTDKPEVAIYPYVRNGTMMTRVVGPVSDSSSKGKYWLLDGRDDDVPAGTPFRITLEWGMRLQVKWERADRILASGGLPITLLGSKPRHRYFIAGSWTSWNALEMQKTGKEGTFEIIIRIGMSRSESFHFLRDQDSEQMIYPAKPALDAGAAEIPVRGPDGLCNGKSWRVTGKYGESVRITLEIVDALVQVSVGSLLRPNSGWTACGVTGPARHSYWVLGSFNGWNPEQMLPGERPGLFILRGVANGSRPQDQRFTIMVDEDPDLVLYPDAPGSIPPGVTMVKGPGRVEDDRDFSLNCLKDGAEFEIVLDLHARDKRKVVDVRWLSDPVDVNSMKNAFLNFFGSR